jgi:hypothetical protein
MTDPVHGKVDRVIEIGLLTEDDRAEWEALTRRFNEHVGTEISDDLYERTWQRLVTRDEIRGIAARLEDRWSASPTTIFIPVSGMLAAATWQTCSWPRNPAGEGSQRRS